MNTAAPPSSAALPLRFLLLVAAAALTWALLRGGRHLLYAFSRETAILPLGLLEHEQGNRGEAIRAYRREIEMNPGHDGSWNNLGVVLCQEKRFAEAEDYFARAVAINPENTNARRNLDRCRLDGRLVAPGSPAPR